MQHKFGLFENQNVGLAQQSGHRDLHLTTTNQASHQTTESLPTNDPPSKTPTIFRRHLCNHASLDTTRRTSAEKPPKAQEPDEFKPPRPVSLEPQS